MSTRKSSHNFVLQIDSSNISRDTNFKPSKALRIKLYYNNSKLRKSRKTEVQIPYEAWDIKARKIKPKYLNSNPELLNCKKELDRIENMIPSIKLRLGKGKITLDTAFIELLEKSEDLNVIDWFNDNWKRKNLKLTTANKHLRVLRAVENHCEEIGEEQYKPLKFPHFADNNSIEKLGTIIRNNPKLSQNTQNNYMKILEQCVGKYDNKLKSCFTRTNQVPKQIEKEVEIVDIRDLYQGIDNIRTLQDLEAYLFWLLSFCLRGLDGQDITLINSKLITSDVEIDDPYIQHYVPEYTPLDEKEVEGYYNNKIYLNMPRKKTEKQNMRILFNAFPTLSIIYHLKRLVKLNHPEYAGSNNDPYAIYGFDVNTQDGLDKWDILRQNYGSKLKRIIGQSFKSTRHTFTSVGVDAGIQDIKLKELLGHSVTKGALKRYKKTDISELDLIHLQIFDDSDVVHVYKNLVETLQDKTTFRSKEDDFFEGQFKWNAIEHYCFAFKLLRWSYQDEWALQKEEKKYNARIGRGMKSMTFDVLPEEHFELRMLRRKKQEAYKTRF
jgi:hypothetical protein